MKKSLVTKHMIDLPLLLILLFVVGPVNSPGRTKGSTPEGARSQRQEAAVAPGGSIDLNGTWFMKDYAPGIGLTKEVNLPGHRPKDCLPVQIPGTVRTALLLAREIPDPYYGYDNEKSLWVEQKEWWFFRTFTPACGYTSEPGPFCK